MLSALAVAAELALLAALVEKRRRDAFDKKMLVPSRKYFKSY